MLWKVIEGGTKGPGSGGLLLLPSGNSVSFNCDDTGGRHRAINRAAPQPDGARGDEPGYRPQSDTGCVFLEEAEAIMVNGVVTERASGTRRNLALDSLRGLIVVWMALDHTNYFVAQRHSSGEHWGGDFPAYGDALTFLTRLVTHPVAPGFSFLMGVGMALFAASRRSRGWSERAIVSHFLIRGLVLIGLQLTVINLAWQLGPQSFPDIYQGVLIALGGGMILGSLFLRLRPVWLLVLAAVLFVGTELSHPDPSQWGLNFDQPLGLIFGYSGGSDFFWSNYPILPWLELVIFGMAFGKWILVDGAVPFRRAWVIGLGALAAFSLLRVFDGFGNIRPRSGDDWIGYLNVVKYPPAMTFTLLTMGFNLILLSLLARIGDGGRRLIKPLTVFGRVPLFFYVTHLYLYAGLAAWLAPSGTSLEVMYVHWLAGLAILYPLCVWYGSFKQRQPANSLLRFL